MCASLYAARGVVGGTLCVGSREVLWRSVVHPFQFETRGRRCPRGNSLRVELLLDVFCQVFHVDLLAFGLGKVGSLGGFD